MLSFVLSKGASLEVKESNWKMTSKDQVVLLGVPQDLETSELEKESCFLGGRPVWFSDPPDPSLLYCPKCKGSERVVFLFQSPASYEEDFDRLLYLFVCVEEDCLQSSDGWILLRSQVRRKPIREACQVEERQSFLDGFCTFKDTWSSEADADLSGTGGTEFEQLVENWKDFSLSLTPKRETLSSRKDRDIESISASAWNNMVPLPQVSLDTVEEPQNEEEFNADPHIQYLQEQFFQNSGVHIDDEDLSVEGSAFFAEIQKEEWKYYKRIERCPNQCVRYQFGGRPLVTPSSKWSNYMASKVPRCQRCGSERVFELQLLSQFLYFLKKSAKKQNRQFSLLDDSHSFMSLSTILVFTCSKDCKAASDECTDISSNNYCREYVLPIFETSSPEIQLLSQKAAPNE